MRKFRIGSISAITTWALPACKGFISLTSKVDNPGTSDRRCKAGLVLRRRLVSGYLACYIGKPLFATMPGVKQVSRMQRHSQQPAGNQLDIARSIPAKAAGIRRRRHRAFRGWRETSCRDSNGDEPVACCLWQKRVGERAWGCGGHQRCGSPHGHLVTDWAAFVISLRLKAAGRVVAAVKIPAAAL